MQQEGADNKEGQRRGTINLRCCLHDLNIDEERTCESIIHNVKGSTIIPMPTHHIDEHGRFSGFVFTCPANAPISAVPLSRYTFYGHTACECEVSSADIIRLLSDINGAKEIMKKFLLNVRDRCSQFPVATFSCRPENAEGYSSSSSLHSNPPHIAGIRTKRTCDSKNWVPEVPDMIGIYHSFVRGHNRDTRVHKLFIIVSGGCCKAADEFYNCVLDCHGHASAKDCALSEEAWWLRRASYRSRCRLVAECAEAFGIKINNIRDIHAYEDDDDDLENSVNSFPEKKNRNVMIAVPTIDTVTYDLNFEKKSNMVEVFDSCVDINNVRNGILCSMHPSEGISIFPHSISPNLYLQLTIHNNYDRILDF